MICLRSTSNNPRTKNNNINDEKRTFYINNPIHTLL